MKSKASSFSVSTPLIAENLRRMWAIPALGFLMYFFSGPFPILMSYKNLDYMAGYIEMSLLNLQPFYMMVHLFLPVVAAVMLFRYLQSVGSTAVMHSMPFTRAKLFSSNYLTGLILIALPIVANGLILLLLSKPTYANWGYMDSMATPAVDVFTKVAVANWMGTSLLIVAVLYSIAVFTAIVTGNSIMHLLASYYFIFLVPLLYMVFNVYFQEFLFGFDLSGSWIERALSISPYTGIIQGGGHFTPGEVLFYLATIAVMTVAGAYLYSRRKLERAGDALTFEFVKPAINYVVAFLGMTMLGFYFLAMGRGRMYLYAGFAAGSIIFFIIGTMVVEKSPRIFNRKGYRHFLIYALIAILFVGGLNLDLTGFENRVPKAEATTWASVEFPDVHYSHKWGDAEEYSLEQLENIEALTAFHQDIVTDKQRLKAGFPDVKSVYFHLVYKGTGRLPSSRRYHIDYGMYRSSPHLKAIFESEEYKDLQSFMDPSIEKYTHVYIHPEQYWGDMVEEFDRSIAEPVRISELLTLLEKDYRAMTFEEYTSLRPPAAHIELEFMYSEEAQASSVQRRGRGYRGFRVPATFMHTVEWLKENGYIREMTAADVQWIDIASAETSEHDLGYKERPMDMSQYRYLMNVSDPEQIQMILDRYETEPVYYDTAYEVTIAYGAEQDYIRGYLNDGIDFLK